MVPFKPADTPEVWKHVNVGLKSFWLPGDPRGCRFHHHKRHSSGNYKAPPPAGEHAGLLRHAQAISQDPVRLSRGLRRHLGLLWLEVAEDLGFTTSTLAVAAQHLHARMLVPNDRAASKRVVGRVKKLVSQRSDRLAGGATWSVGSDPRWIRRGGHSRIRGYILDHLAEGGWTWDDALGTCPDRRLYHPAAPAAWQNPPTHAGS